MLLNFSLRLGFRSVSMEFSERQTESLSSSRAQVARERFELSSAGPKPAMLGHYTTGLQQSRLLCTTDLFSSWSLSFPRSNKRSHRYGIQTDQLNQNHAMWNPLLALSLRVIAHLVVLCRQGVMSLESRLVLLGYYT